MDVTISLILISAPYHRCVLYITHIHVILFPTLWNVFYDCQAALTLSRFYTVAVFFLILPENYGGHFGTITVVLSLKRCKMSISSLFVKIWYACCDKFKADILFVLNLYYVGSLYNLVFYLGFIWDG